MWLTKPRFLARNVILNEVLRSPNDSTFARGHGTTTRGKEGPSDFWEYVKAAIIRADSRWCWQAGSLDSNQLLVVSGIPFAP